MKAKLSPEKNVLKIEMSREQMMLFGWFFKEKYFPLLDHERFWWIQQISILGGIFNRCRIMVAQNEMKNSYKLSFSKHEAVALMYITVNVINDDDTYPLLLSFSSESSDEQYQFVNRETIFIPTEIDEVH